MHHPLNAEQHGNSGGGVWSFEQSPQKNVDTNKVVAESIYNKLMHKRRVAFQEKKRRQEAARRLKVERKKMEARRKYLLQQQGRKPKVPHIFFEIFSKFLG